MLVLSRKNNESIILYVNPNKDDDHVKITIVGLSNNRVQLGIEAPYDVTIDREEVYVSRMKELNNEK